MAAKWRNVSQQLPSLWQKLLSLIDDAKLVLKHQWRLNANAISANNDLILFRHLMEKNLAHKYNL